MLKAGMQLGAVGFLLAIILCLASSADARHRRYYGYHQRYPDQYTDTHRDSDRYDPDDRTRRRDLELPDPRSRRGRGGGTFSAMVQQLIRVCGQQGVELKSWPFDSIARIVRPDETQRSALEQLRTTANQTADTLASDCPQDPPTAPSDQLEAAERGLETAIAALKAVQPAITTFYTSLDDEQKARLVARHLAASASQESVRRSRSRAYGSSDRDLSPPPWDSICEQWAAALRDWPISRIERTVRLTETQRVALYDVVASSLKAAGTLMTSCPTEIALTPAARMETLRKRLEAVRRATEAIHPALAQFYETLDNNQKTRFAEMN